jgi:hypothetical protein
MKLFEKKEKKELLNNPLMGNLQSQDDVKNLIDKLKVISDKQRKEFKTSAIASKVSNLETLKLGKLFLDEKDELAKDFFKKYQLKEAYNPVTHGLNAWFFIRRLDFRGLKTYRYNTGIYNKYHDHALHITMELKKGGKKMFWVNETEDGFLYNEGQYIFDPNMKYPITTTLGNEYSAYDFYEGWPLPFKHEFPIRKVIDGVKKGMAGEEIQEIDYATHPPTLLRFVMSDIIKKLFASDAILPMLQLMFYIVIAGAVLGLVNLVLNIIVLVKISGTKTLVETLGTNLQNFITSLQLAMGKN